MSLSLPGTMSPANRWCVSSILIVVTLVLYDRSKKVQVARIWFLFSEHRAEMFMNTERQEKLQSELDRFLPVLIGRFRAIKIIVFGSFVGNEISEWSDLDIVVVRETTERFLDRSAELLQALQPQVGVDFLVYTPEEWDGLVRDNLFVRTEIHEKGKVLYAA